MNKAAFLDELKRQLSGRPQSEIDAAIQYYDEFVSDKILDGASEENAVEEMGNVADVAKAVSSAEFTSPKNNSDGAYQAAAPTEIIIDDFDVKCRIIPSPDNQFHIYYSENKFRKYEITENGSKILVKSKRLLPVIINWIGMRLSKLTIELPRGNIRLRADFTNSIIDISDVSFAECNVHNTNGHIALERISAETAEAVSTNAALTFKSVCSVGNITAKTTNSRIILNDSSAADTDAFTTNSSISVSELSCRGLSMHTDNGAIDLSGIKSDFVSASTSNSHIHADGLRCTEKVELNTANSDISVKGISASACSLVTKNAKICINRVDSPSIYLETKNASVSGTLPGSVGDYNIKSRTSNSGSSLPTEFAGGGKRLEVYTTNGAINIGFEA